MFRIGVLVALAIALGACDAIGTLTDGWRYAKAVERELEQSTGIKPQVGFSWRNGRLETVTVTFPQIDEAKPLREIADAVRHSVADQFKQTPGDILLVFSLRKTGLRSAAQTGS
jgi:hypothetical protein